ncbi:outer membrane beta-barrel protein [Roseimarinus sediminis]|jgi:hypothetical protein|uniref:outer membrane beta-barrel protein n=1 Tax=Roseimarinus sediminis TaxID=1610899 RepID=UPI003D1FDF16
MKYFYLIFLLFAVLTTKSQVRTGFQLGGNIMHDRTEMPYLVHSFHTGGEAGIVLEFPLIKNSFVLSTGLNFYDYYYQLRPNEVGVSYNSSYGSTIHLFANINEAGVNLPLKLSLIRNRFLFEAGFKLCKNVSSSNEIKERIAGMTYGYPDWPDYIQGVSYDEIKIAEYKWFFEVGAGYLISPHLKVSIEYAWGLNDYMQHTMYLKVVNDELISPPEEYKIQLNKIGMNLVYFPRWDFIKKKKNSSEKRGLLKEFYQ